MIKSFIVVMSLAVSAGAFARETDHSTVETGLTPEQGYEREIRNESYNKGYEDGKEKGKEEGRQKAEFENAMEDLLDGGESRKRKK